MRTHGSVPGRSVLVVMSLLAVLGSTGAQPQGGNLSGVVLPDLPPEVSPGEEISFTPPAGSEAGTWTLSGVVAEEEQPEEQPAPGAARVTLKPSPGMPPLSETQQVALALAAAIEQEPWASCASGKPAAGFVPRGGAVGEPLPDVDVAIEKKPVPQYAVRMIVSELSPEQVSSLKASPINTHQNQQERYFGAQLESLGDGGEPAYRKFYESRSNTARQVKLPDSTLYSLLRPGGSKRPVEVTSGDHLFDATVPPVVVALGMSAGGPKEIALTPVQCADARAASRPRGVPLVFQVFTCSPADGGRALRFQVQPAGKRAGRPSGKPLGKCTLKGGIAVKPGFVPAREQEGALAGVELSIREPLSDRVLQRAVTDAGGNVTFEPVSGDDGSIVARQVCNSAGDCFDLQPLPQDPGPVLEPIDFPDPPFKPMNAPPGPRPDGPPTRLVFKVPEFLKPGRPFSVSYKDPSGKILLDVPAVPGVTVVPPRPVGPAPSLDAAPEYVIAGRPVCACGNFPDARSRNGFLFDEQAISALSASSHMAILPLAATVRPGRHPISGSPDAGFSARDVVFTTVINVNGKLDANQLKRGQSTQMELTIVGTDKPIGLRVVNNTPRNISIGGRTDQVLTTTGGSNNHVVQKVDSVAPGNFSIDFSLAADRCPCQGK